MKGPILLTLLALATACGSQPASEAETASEQIRVLTAGSLDRALVPIAEAFRAETGHEVSIEVGTTPVMTERLESGEKFDIVIGTGAVVDAAVARGELDASTSQMAGRVGIGIGVRSGVEIPEVETVDELRTLLLEADTVVYNRGSSGVFSQSMIESLGIAEQIADRTTQYANGGQVIAHVLEGEGTDLGFAPLTEVRANAPNGLAMVALPEAVQNYTSYNAVAATNAPESAREFIRYLTTPGARETFAATGVD
jgi:molybdate transport system substrate-binding protein